jgi:hypothetical protein
MIIAIIMFPELNVRSANDFEQLNKSHALKYRRLEAKYYLKSTAVNLEDKSENLISDKIKLNKMYVYVDTSTMRMG